MDHLAWQNLEPSANVLSKERTFFDRFIIYIYFSNLRIFPESFFLFSLQSSFPGIVEPHERESAKSS